MDIEKQRFLRRYQWEYLRFSDLSLRLREITHLHASKIRSAKTNELRGLDSLLVEWDTLKEECVGAKEEMLRVRKEITGAINKVGGAPGRVLFLRYIELLKFREIMERTHYTERHVHRLHRIGLDRLTIEYEAC